MQCGVPRHGATGGLGRNKNSSKGALQQRNLVLGFVLLQRSGAKALVEVGTRELLVLEPPNMFMRKQKEAKPWQIVALVQCVDAVENHDDHPHMAAGRAGSRKLDDMAATRGSSSYVARVSAPARAGKPGAMQGDVLMHASLHLNMGG